MEVERLQLLALLHQDDMPAEGRQERLAHLVGLQGEGLVLELLHHLVAAEPSQHAAATGRPWVLRHLLGQLLKVGASLQGSIDGVDAALSLVLLGLRGLLLHQHQDVGGAHQSVRTNALHRLVVHLVSLSHQVIIGHEGRQHLLVAILGKLLLEGLRRIQTGVQGCLYLQLVVDKQVDIFLDGLLVNDAVGIILVIAVLKL